jgi:hypothetical protein
MSTWLEESIDDPNLLQSVQDLMKTYPASTRIIERLVRYYDNKPAERDAKRRKIEESALSSNEVLRIIDVSFQLPARKRYDIIITTTHLLLHNSKTNTIEFQYKLTDLSPLGGACVPSPDKAAKSFTYVIFLKADDCIVFSTQDKGDITLRKPNTADETLSVEKHEKIAQLFTTHTGVPMTQPSKEYFRSTGVSSSTGKVEDRSHVVAYLKAKDGFLFFLPTGILFGFKKPTLFFPITHLASNVITNITQRTFDLTLTLKPGCQILGSAGFRTAKEGDDDTVQFSMIEQSEYGGIEAYTKKLGINDQSMAEERKAASTKNEDNYSEDEDDNKVDVKGKGKASTTTEQEHHEDSEENDEDFEPSDGDSDPLEYDTDATDDENEANRELIAEEEHEFEDAMSEDDAQDDDEVDLLDDESD